MKKIAVYTAIFGNYDDLKNPVHINKLQEQADFFCFTDNKKISSNYYNVKLVERPLNDPVKCNRYFKILSHQILPEYDYVLYVDANVQITCDNLCLIIKNYLNETHFAVFRHTLRKCLYKEAKWVLSDETIDEPHVVEKQIERYKNEQFPENYGLIAGTFLLRKHNEPEIQNFNELWWQEVLGGSRRDQLSFDYVRWKTSLNLSYLQGSWEENFIGIRTAHKKNMPSENVILRFLKSIVPEKIKNKYRYNNDPNFRNCVDKGKELNRIKLLSDYEEFDTGLFGKPIKANSNRSFLFLYKELFEEEVYHFTAKNNQPYIIDCGTNIGMSVIYFKLKYPNSCILGFEPDENLYKLSINNITSLAFKDVEIINKGLWSEEGTIQFYNEGSDAGRIAKLDDLSNIKEIETVKLSKYLNKNVDFLKIDIEGAEINVLKECADQLHNVSSMFIEYHSFVNEKQELSQLIEILEKANFRYNIGTPLVINPKPFIQEKNYLGMDFLLNIYAFRK